MQEKDKYKKAKIKLLYFLQNVDRALLQKWDEDTFVKKVYGKEQNLDTFIKEMLPARNHVFHNGQNILHIIAQTPYTVTLNKLFLEGIDANHLDKFGKTPLHYALETPKSTLRTCRYAVLVFILAGLTLNISMYM